MGKAARNEQHKQRANFWNNLASACAISGFIVPALTLYAAVTRALYVGDLFKPESFAPGVALVFGSFGAAGVACSLALLFRRLSDGSASEIED